MPFTMSIDDYLCIDDFKLWIKSESLRAVLKAMDEGQKTVLGGLYDAFDPSPRKKPSLAGWVDKMSRELIKPIGSSASSSRGPGPRGAISSEQRGISDQMLPSVFVGTLPLSKDLLHILTLELSGDLPKEDSLTEEHFNMVKSAFEVFSSLPCSSDGA